MKKLILCILLFLYQLTSALFDYDRAAYLAQQEKWSDAGHILNGLIVDNPHRPDMLYDAGCVAFNKQDYHQAKAYFEAAAQNDVASRELKERAYFNKGNTHVALQELKESLLAYEQTLMLNADNEAAKHNYEVIKKMLDQQQQEQQQNQQSDKEENNSEQSSQEDQHDKEGQQDKQTEDRQHNDEQHNMCNNEKQQNKQGDESQSGNDSQNADQGNEQQHEQQERDHEGLDQEGDQHDQQERPTDQEQKSQQDKQGDERKTSSQNSKQHEQAKQPEKRDEHQPSLDSQENDLQQDMQEGEKEQGMNNAQQVPLLDPAFEQVLAKRSDRDSQLNKQLIKALVNQEMKGRHGENCW